MVESAGLLNRCRGNTLPQVRILSSPLRFFTPFASCFRATTCERRFSYVPPTGTYSGTNAADFKGRNPAVAKFLNPCGAVVRHPLLNHGSPPTAWSCCRHHLVSEAGLFRISRTPLLLGVRVDKRDLPHPTRGVLPAQMPVVLDHLAVRMPDPLPDVSFRRSAKERLGNEEVIVSWM